MYRLESSPVGGSSLGGTSLTRLKIKKSSKSPNHHHHHHHQNQNQNHHHGAHGAFIGLVRSRSFVSLARTARTSHTTRTETEIDFPVEGLCLSGGQGGAAGAGRAGVGGGVRCHWLGGWWLCLCARPSGPGQVPTLKGPRGLGDPAEAPDHVGPYTHYRAP